MRPYLVVVATMGMVLSLVPVTVGAEGTIVSGQLSPVVENPKAGPNGRGEATLTISGDRTLLSWVITYTGVSSAITAVNFCGGNNPRVVPIGLVCADVIAAAAAGPSPITGSRAIVPAQANNLDSGYAVIQLASAAGPQLYGYIGPSPVNGATRDEPASATSSLDALGPVVVGLATFIFVIARWRRAKLS